MVNLVKNKNLLANDPLQFQGACLKWNNEKDGKLSVSDVLLWLIHSKEGNKTIDILYHNKQNYLKLLNK